MRWFKNFCLYARPEQKTLAYLFEQMRTRFRRRENDVRVVKRNGYRQWAPVKTYQGYAGVLRRMTRGSSVFDDQLLGYFLQGIDRTTSDLICMQAPRTLAEAANMPAK